MSEKPTQYKVDQAVDLLTSLNSGVIIALNVVRDTVADGEGNLKQVEVSRSYDNNLEPLLNLMATTNFNTVELDKIIEATNKLTDSIYHPRAEFDAAIELRTTPLLQANSSVAQAVENIEEGKPIKLGVNDNFKEFIQTKMNQSFRDNVGNYAYGVLIHEANDQMEFLAEKGEKLGWDREKISHEQTKFMTELKAGELGMSPEDKQAKLNKALNNYSLFTEGQVAKDPKSLAKEIVNSIDGYMDDLYSRRKARNEESAQLGFEAPEDPSSIMSHARPRMGR